MSYISRLALSHFRSYENARLEGLSPGLIVLSGPNGAGKTNILEPVSLLTPGRGLRGAGAFEMQRQHITLSHGEREGPAKREGEGLNPWAISATVQTSGGPVKLGTGLDTQTGRRKIQINGVPAKSQMALSDYLSCVWLTPQMDRLFIDGAGGRRRFLDKLVFAYDPGHSGRATRYENALRQRSKILSEGEGDPAWLTGLEQQMAQTGVALAAARLEFVRRLQKACLQAGSEEKGFFPQAGLSVRGTIEELLQKAPALEVEEMFVSQLARSRVRDAQTGGAATGPHKSDLSVSYAAKNMAAGQCSTGEQKALLIGIILAHARLMAAERGSPPALLLDEIAAHLDEDRRAVLFGLLHRIGGQVWMSGADLELFSAIENNAQFFSVGTGEILLLNQGLAA